MTPFISRMRYPAALALSLILALPPVSRAEGKSKDTKTILAGKLDIKSEDAATAKEAPQVRKDMAARFYRFMAYQGEDEGKTSYISSEARENGVHKDMKGLIRKWVEESFDDKRYVGKKAKVTAPVAHLYYVLGAGKDIPDDGEELPSWARKHPDLKDNLGGFHRDELVTGMVSFTKASEDGLGEYHRGQLGGGQHSLKWVRGFLDAAAEHAFKIVAEGRTKKELESAILKDEGKSDIPTVGGGTGGDKSGISRRYTTNELYVDGGAHAARLSGPDDKISRSIAMKLVTVKTPTGLQDRIEVCDLTNVKDIFCQTFPINHKGMSQEEPLDDRVAGKMKYKLEMVSDNKGGLDITFGRGGDPPMTAIKTKLKELYKRRAELAETMGRIKTINGKEFYSLGQGYPPSLLFFPISGKDRKAALSPTAIAQTQEFYNGKFQVIRGKPDLGDIGGKPFHLEFNKDTGVWDVVEEKGDIKMVFDGIANVKNTIDPKTGEWVGPKTDTKGTGGDTTGGNKSDSPPSGTLSDVPAIRKIEDGTFGDMTGMYEPADKLNQALSPELKKFIRFHKVTAAGEKKHLAASDVKRYIIIVADKKFINSQNTYAPYFPGAPAGPWKHVDIKVLDGHFLVTQSDKGSWYFDLAVKGDGSVFKHVGTVREVNGTMSIEGLKSGKLLGDAMLRAGMSPEDARKGNDNVKEAAKDKVIDVINSKATVNVVATFDDGTTRQIWPTLGKLLPKPDKDGSDAKGPGMPFSAIDGGPDAKIKDKNKGGSGGDVENVSVYDGLKSENAVLYVNEVAKGKGTNAKPRRWYIQYKYKNYNEATERYSIFISEAKLLFGEGSKDLWSFPYEASPKLALNLFGLTQHKAGKTDLRKTGSTLRLVDRGSVTDKRGVWAAFKTKATAPKDKKGNCLAPLVWWGMDKAAAEKACVKDSY